VRQADALVRVNGAPLLPSLDAAGAASRQRVRQPAAGSLLYNEFSAQLSTSYELDFWGKNRARRAAAVANAQGSRYDRTTVALTTEAGVASTYFSVLELSERVAIAQANLQSASMTLEGIKLQQTAGVATALDVAQQETVVATLSAAIPPLEDARQHALDALAILVGRVPQGFAVSSTSLAQLSEPVIDPGLPSELLQRRPDVAEAEAQLRAAHADIVAARAAFFPSIELTGAGGFESTAFQTLFQPGSSVYQIAAGLTQPIFHGGAVLGQYQFSKARYSELVADYHKAVISAFANTEDALSAARSTQTQLERETVAVAKAQRAYEIAQTQMHAGTVNILTVLNTETALFAAQDALAQVRYARLAALVELYKSLGGGWDSNKED